MQTNAKSDLAFYLSICQIKIKKTTQTSNHSFQYFDWQIQFFEAWGLFTLIYNYIVRMILIFKETPPLQSIITSQDLDKLSIEKHLLVKTIRRILASLLPNN